MTLLPPPQYDFPPAVPVIEHVLPFFELQRMCLASQRGLKSGEALFGCARLIEDRTKCEVFLVHVNSRVAMREHGISRWYTEVDLVAVRRHELAHCNGWPADHPGGRE